jgi:hypothetical protein
VLSSAGQRLLNGNRSNRVAGEKQSHSKRVTDKQRVD